MRGHLDSDNCLSVDRWQSSLTCQQGWVLAVPHQWKPVFSSLLKLHGLFPIREGPFVDKVQVWGQRKAPNPNAQCISHFWMIQFIQQTFTGCPLYQGNVLSDKKLRKMNKACFLLLRN